MAAHRTRRSAAYRALLALARGEADAVASLAGLAAFGRTVDWLSGDVPLPEEPRGALLGMRDAGLEVASALESDSASNRVRRLEEAASAVESLRLRPAGFGPSLARWGEIVRDGLAEARRRQAVEEPVPQPYLSDGRPIRPPGGGGPAVQFRGRETLFRQLEEALGAGAGRRATLLLYGQRRSGKTSVLLHLPERLGSRVTPAFVDVQSEKVGGAGDAAGALAGIAGAVCDEARRHRHLALPGLERAELARDPYPAWGRWLDRVEALLGEGGGGRLLLCLDEFEAFEEAIAAGRLDTRLLDSFRHTIQHRARISILLSGSHRVEELPPRWSSALITVSTLPIGFLEERDARGLIERPIPDFPALYTPAAVERVVHLTRCQPFLVQVTCALLVERMNRARRAPPESLVTVEDVDGVIGEALVRGATYFSNLWAGQAPGRAAQGVLEALARAPGDTLDGAAVRGLGYGEDDRREALRALLRREIVERVDDGKGYRVTVPLVAEYVRRELVV